MQFLILLGSPRKQGNTISLVEPFVSEIKESGNNVNIIWLYDKKIKGCVACRSCQKDWTRSGCNIGHTYLQLVMSGTYESCA